MCVNMMRKMCVLGAYVGNACLWVSMKLHVSRMPSWMGMLVYSDVTSAVHMYVWVGSGGMVSRYRLNAVLSWMYDGVSVARGCRKCVMYLARLSVGPSMADTMGLSGT